MRRSFVLAIWILWSSPGYSLGLGLSVATQMYLAASELYKLGTFAGGGVARFGEKITDGIAFEVGKYISALVVGGVSGKIIGQIDRHTSPKLFDEAHTLSEYHGDRLEDLLLDDRTSLEVGAFVDHFVYAVKTGQDLPRMILYGAPGVGKTEIARRILSTVPKGTVILKQFTGSDFQKHPDDVKKLLTYVGQPLKQKVILFVDEAESAFRASGGYGYRSSGLQTFLAETGKGSKNYTIIFATNFVEQLDDAVFRRFDYKVKMRLPDAKLRLKLLKHFIEQGIKKEINQGKVKPVPSSLFQDENFLTAFESGSEGLSPILLQNAVELVLAKARRSGGIITHENILTQIENEKQQQAELAITKRAQEHKEKMKQKEADDDETLRKLIEKLKNSKSEQDPPIPRTGF